MVKWLLILIIVGSLLIGFTSKAQQPLQRRILGVWTNKKTKNATFEIRKNTIYYVDHFQSYKYPLKADVIKIYYEDFIYTAKIYINKDALVMDSQEDGISKFWKFKN